MTKNWYQEEMAEGREEILELCRLTTWRGVLRRKKKKAGFRSLFHTNPVNGRPFIIVREYFDYIMEYNKPQKK